MWTGSFINQASVDNNLRVVVIGGATADDLGLTDSSIGSTIYIGGLPFDLVGITQSKGGTGTQDDQAIVPLSTARELFGGGDSVSAIGVSATEPGRDQHRLGRDHATLDQRHGITASEPADFTIADQAQLFGTVSSVSDVLDAAARRHRLDLAARGRHRDHEHHAGLGPRADARDRHPQGHRRPRPRHPRPVPGRGPGALARRRPHRHRLRASSPVRHRHLRRLGLRLQPGHARSSPSSSASWWASSSASGLPARPPGSIPSSPFDTNRHAKTKRLAGPRSSGRPAQSLPQKLLPETSGHG